MAKQTIRLEGFRELEEALAEELPKATAKAVLRRTATKAMERIRLKMGQLAPYDAADRDEDGEHLRDSMRTQVVKARRQRGGRYARSSGVEVRTGPAPVGKANRFNAAYQERGTVKMAANPYARPAADSEGHAVIAEVKSTLTEEIDKAKARIKAKAAKVKG